MIRLLAAALLLLFPLPRAEAQVPPLMKFQGRLVDPGTKNPLEGSYSFTFRLCDSLAGACAGGAKLWEETQSVSASNGAFDATLGAVVALSSAVFSGAAQYLEIQVEGETLAPREPVLSVPAAFRAAGADSLAAGDPDYIQLRGDLQEGATFYVSSGTVEGRFEAMGEVSAGAAAVIKANLAAGGILTVGSGAHALTGAAGLLDASKLDSSGYVPNASIDSSSVAKFNAAGLIDGYFIDSASVTKRGNAFNAPEKLVVLDGFGKVQDALVDASSVTKLANRYNLPLGPAKVAGDSHIEDFLIDGSSVAKLDASGQVADALLDSSSVTLQGSLVNAAGRLARLDANGNLTLPYGISGSTARFSASLGVNTSAPNAAVHILNADMKVENGEVQALNSDVVISTTGASKGVRFQTGRRQVTASRWELVSRQTGASPITFSSLNGDSDDTYLLVYRVVSNGATEWGLRFNGDTGNNYEMVTVNSDGAGDLNSDDSGAINYLRVPGDFLQAGGDRYSGELKIFARTTTTNRHVIDQHLRDDGGSGSLEWSSGAGFWYNTTANITQIEALGSFAAGSEFSLYRRLR